LHNYTALTDKAYLWYFIGLLVIVRLVTTRDDARN
jgi:hypothetical protein